MRAAIWKGPGEMELGEVPDATCPADGALLRVVACGICGTDVRTFYNGDRRIEPGAVLGHEICGEVLEIGAEADGDLRAGTGDLVHVISTLYCGVCTLCRTGNEHLCQAGGLMGFDYQGAYAELVAVPHVALALAQGAGIVYLLETEAKRLELAHKVLDDDRVRYVDTSAVDAVEHIKAETGDGAERVIVACSNARAQEQAMEMAAPRGRVLFFGGLPKGTTTIDFPSNVLHYREVAVLGSYASRYRDQVQALDMLEQNTANIRGVVTDVVPLEEAPR